MTVDLTPEQLLDAYRAGVFPMAESRDDPTIFWVKPQRRGVLPLEGFHISRSLKRKILAEPFQVRTDTDFGGVIKGCADRPDTWISPPIAELYHSLFTLGHAHSVEVWDDAALVGGVYGVTLGGAFFGESMFSHRRDASKIALAYLVDRLRIGGFTLFDTQFLTAHLATLGAEEISRAAYQAGLRRALAIDADFNRQTGTPSGQGVIQRNTQIS